MNKITVIVGPTGTGKSGLAIRLAQKLGGVIVSADSRQIYSYADVGTNKVPLPEKDIISIKKQKGCWEVNGVTIYGYDLVTPDQDFSVNDYVKYASDIVFSITGEQPVFLVGGTGFYVDALLGIKPFSTTIPDNHFRNEMKDASLEQIQSILKKIDSSGFNTLNDSDKKNKQRLIRYIELAREHGTIEEAKVYSPLKDNIIYQKIGLKLPQHELENRIDTWIESICNGELQLEVEDLLSRGYKNTKLLSGIIYDPMVRFIQNSNSLEETIEIIKIQTRQYIKRQYTWFQSDEKTRWINVSKEAFDHEVYKLLEFS